MAFGEVDKKTYDDIKAFNPHAPSNHSTSTKAACLQETGKD